MGIELLPSYVGGKIITDQDNPDRTAEIKSLDGSFTSTVVATSTSQIRNAIRAADDYQKKLNSTPMEERIAVAEMLVKEYAKHKWTVARGLGLFRGQVAKDSFWMCDLISQWGSELDTFLSTIFGNVSDLSVPVTSSIASYGQVVWQSRGTAAMYCAASMDGPPNITALCHGIISGTHMIIRPSWRDTVTHLAFDILYKHGLHEYAQLVRWPSSAEEGNQNNKQLLNNVSQGLIFSSDETYAHLINSAAPEGSEAWRGLTRKCRRYGTGLPINIVTEASDLEATAGDLVAGARLGCGRFCLSTTPVLVQQNIYKDLVEAVVSVAKSLRPGSILDPKTDLCGYDPSELQSVTNALKLFGGDLKHGEVRGENTDVFVLENVSAQSPCLYAEIGAPVLGFIPYRDLTEAIRIANVALTRNQRDAWTAMSVHGNYDNFTTLRSAIPNFRALLGGVVAEGKLLLPHQGTYFVLDLMRRTTIEDVVATHSTRPLKKTS
ncbi:MAG: aldehyde dehydrogenase family protein [Oligoflexales bacterium]